MKRLNNLKIALICIVSFFTLHANGQVVLSGLVLDSEQESIPGATVIVENTTIGVSTDIDGHFTLDLKDSNVNVVVSFIGMESQIIPVSSIEDKSNMVVTLLSGAIGLEDLVVIGYGSQKRSNVTGAISSVKAEDMKNSVVQRPEQALQGKVAGVQVMSNSGQPGAAISVKIRGVGTTGNSQPLYIVDGSPSGDISYLSATDIKSMEVLKDAAASSIYGARGANGVVIITTNTGGNNGFKITYDGYYGVQNSSSKVDVLNAEEYTVIMNEAYYNAGNTEQYIDPAMLDKTGKEGTDWQDEIFSKNAGVTSHALSMSGGTENTSQNYSFSYFSQDGIVAKEKSNYERFNFRLNDEVRAYDDRLKVGVSLVYSHITTKGVDANSEWGSPTGLALNMDPITAVYNEDGTFGQPYNDGMQEVVNPVAKIHYLHDKYRTDKVVGNIYAEYKIIEGLKFKTAVGLDYAYQVQDTYTPEYELSPIVRNETSDVYKGINRWFTYNLENTLVYTKSFGKHDITGLVGNTLLTSSWENLTGFGSELIIDSPDNAYLGNVGNNESFSAGGSASENSLVSFFGRANYAYEDKYLASLTVRQDGSSRFGSNNKFATFPSLSTGWVMSEENFMSDVYPISFLKIRASWGQNGNESIGDFMYMSSIENNRNYNFGDGSTETGSAPSRVSNPDLKWETSEQLDFGFDLRFTNNIFVNFDWYHKQTKDLLIEAPIPDYVGNSAPFVNGGNVSNKGVELLVGYNLNKGDFSFGATLNVSTNKNEVTDINNDEKRIYGQSVGPSGMKNITMASVGNPIGYFWGYETDGIFQNETEVMAHSKDGELIQTEAVAGDLRYVDQNNDGKIDDSDRINLGDPHADVTTGLSLNFGYKGWDMSMFLYGVFGNQVVDASRRYDLPAANYQTSVLDRWTGEGTSNTTPRVTFDDANGNLSNFSDYMVHDASYLRLKNLQVGYTFDENALRRMKISKMRLYVSGENLFTLTKYQGYNPEVGSSDDIFGTGIDKGVYPTPSTYTIGASITF